MNRAKFGAMGAMLLFCVVAIAQEKAGEIKEASGGEGGEIRLRTLAPITCVYVESETTFDKLGEAIQEEMPQIIKAAEDGKFKLSLPFVVSYPGGMAHSQPQKPFKVQIGTKVEGEATVKG